MSAPPQKKSDTDEKRDSTESKVGQVEPKPQESSLGIQNNVYPHHSPELLRSLAHQHSEMSKM